MTDLFVGVDLGGTNITAAYAPVEFVGTKEKYQIHHSSIPTESHEGPHAVLARVTSYLKDIEESANGAIKAIGMGVPGLVDIETGVTKFLPNMPTQWRDVPVAATISKEMNCPVKLLNDVRLATLGELKFGHAVRLDKPTIVYFSLGTGVGGGVAIDGKLRLGPLGAAGEIGHQTIVPNGLLCGCGNRGCLETVASGPAIAAEGVRLMRMGMAPTLYEMVDGDADKVTPAAMGEAAEYDFAVGLALTQAANYIGTAAANIVLALYPDLVILGGGVSNLGPLLPKKVKEEIDRRIGMFPTDDILVELSDMAELSGVFGGLALAASAVEQQS